MHFVGTATSVLRIGGFTLLTDPNFLHRGQWAYLGYGLASRRRTEPTLAPSQLPELDAVVLSHLHGDHFDRVARRSLQKDLPILTTPHAARRLGRWGFGSSQGLRTWQHHRMQRDGETLTVTSLPGVHAFGLMGRLLPPVMGSMLEYTAAPGHRPLRIYLSGDTLYHDQLAGIQEAYPQIDVAVLHLGGTRVLNTLVTMDAQQGADLLQLLRPECALPVHYDDYGVFRSPLSDFQAEVQRREPASRVHYLGRGDTYQLPELPVH